MKFQCGVSLVLAEDLLSRRLSSLASLAPFLLADPSAEITGVTRRVCYGLELKITLPGSLLKFNSQSVILPVKPVDRNANRPNPISAPLEYDWHIHHPRLAFEI